MGNNHFRAGYFLKLSWEFDPRHECISGDTAAYNNTKYPLYGTNVHLGQCTPCMFVWPLYFVSYTWADANWRTGCAVLNTVVLTVCLICSRYLSPQRERVPCRARIKTTFSCIVQVIFFASSLM